MKPFKKIQKHLIIVVLCGTFFMPLALFAATPEENLASFVEIINEVRLDPFARGEYLGYERMSLGETLPWLKESYAPLVLDPFLCTRADVRNDLEGDVPDPEMSAGNDYVRTGEVGGAVVFFNFLSQKTVFRMIVDNILERELNPERVGGLNLLEPDFTRVGIAIRAGIEVVEGKKQNAYFVTICFGSSQLRSAVQVLTMVNQVRFQPEIVKTYLGDDFELLSQWLWRYPPLMDSSSLHASARSYSKQVVAFDPEPSPQPFARAVGNGFGGYGVDEYTTLRILPLGEGSAQVAGNVFLSLLNKEVQAAPGNAGVFSQEGNEAGVGLAISPVAVVPGVEFVSAVFDVGAVAPDGDGRVGIYGVVYSDIDENKLYSPGEGRGVVTVEAFRKSDGELAASAVVTDLAGHFSLRLDPNEWYIFKSTVAGEVVGSSEIWIAADRFLPIRLPDPEPMVESLE